MSVLLCVAWVFKKAKKASIVQIHFHVMSLPVSSHFRRNKRNKMWPASDNYQGFSWLKMWQWWEQKLFIGGTHQAGASGGPPPGKLPAFL